MPQQHSATARALKQSFPSASQKRILTDVEVAERLGVSRFTVRSWRLKGVGPRFLKMGRAVRYRSEDVDEYERQVLVETRGPSDEADISSRAAFAGSRAFELREPSETDR
jgi:excisionase family DNA binding protein